MIKNLKLTGVGPAPTMELEFGERLNIITGDNGLGKSFLLDTIWWALTRKWPSEVNKSLVSGKKARPQSNAENKSIEFLFDGKTPDKAESYESSWLPREEAWSGRPGRPANPGLVLYAMSDGSFAVWDPARNYWKTQNRIDVQDRPPAYVFAPAQIWDGLPSTIKSDESFCEGLIRDWRAWQGEKNESFELLKHVLKELSPSAGEPLEPGELTRISKDDARDLPTIRMPYQQDVPIIHASAGMRRIIALAYCLVWAWQEHKEAAKLNEEEPANQIIFLIDEIEAHLHPTWQSSILPAMSKVFEVLNAQAKTQLITVTHSPLVMASLEPEFDLSESSKDAWFDLNLEDGKAVLSKLDFEKHGDISNWLTSEAFDQPTSRARKTQKLLDDALELTKEGASPNKAEILEIEQKLATALSPLDKFWPLWNYFCEKKGLHS
ncbi:MAG: AAA family ATPase [Puniceicoccales bacterium]|jgi:predicted ATPase|nr:AAA family ATPase [Puniceicoccales bacterium]